MTDTETEELEPTTMEIETEESSTETINPSTTQTETITPTIIRDVSLLPSHTFTGDDCIVTYLEHEVVKDIDSKDALKISFKFTNTTESSDMPTGLFDIWAYQYDISLNRWVELEPSYPMVTLPSDITDAQNIADSTMPDLQKEVQPGATVNISAYYQLRNQTLVHIVVANWDYCESDPNKNYRYSLGLIEVVDDD